MPASIHVKLDTTPPQVVLGVPDYNSFTKHLTVPYVIDEPQILDAFYREDGTGTEVSMASIEGTLFAQLPDDVNRPGVVHVLARDRVFNASETTVPVAAHVTIVSAIASAAARIGSMATSLHRYVSRADTHEQFESTETAEGRFTGRAAARRGE